MRKNSFLFSLILLLSLTILINGQDKQKQVEERKKFRYRNAKMEKINIEIDNMRYWKKMAKLGYIEVQPNQELDKAVYTGTTISAESVVSENSPDVPVIDATNTTQSENSIFVNPSDPTNVLNSNNSTQYPLGNLYGANDFYSFDTGLTWDGEVQGAGGSNSGDPAAAIGLNGYYYVGQIADNSGQGIGISTNQGTTWSQVTIANPPSGWWDLLDKNHLWIDNSPTSPYEGNLYAAWTPFGGSNDHEVELKRSANDGSTWEGPVVVSTGSASGYLNQGVNIQTGPEGQVYVCWTIYDGSLSDEDAIGFAKSSDGGVTFSTGIRAINNIRGIRSSETSKDQRVNSFPVMACDISNTGSRGNLYIVWTNIGVPGTNTGSDRDIYLIKSTDEGENWSDPIRVNQDEMGLGNEHYFPWITVDPVTGIVSVVFYDDRNVGGTQVEVYCANSLDAGETWEDFKVSDVAFTPSPIPGLAGGYMGDYIGISARNGWVYPVWTDNRGSNVNTYVSPYQVSTTPIANFSAYPTFGTDPLTVQFSDESYPGLNGVSTYLWDFGDGYTSSEANPEHTYQEVGVFTVSLTVEGPIGGNPSTLTKENHIEVVDNLTSQFDVTAHWNMISVPLNADDMSVSTLFPNASSPAYKFDNGYVQEDVLSNGAGYWLKFPQPELVSVFGENPTSDITINEGWNLIGPFNSDIPVENITTEPAGLIASQWFGFDDFYVLANTLNKGKAYWVKASGDGTLNLNPGPAKKSDKNIRLYKADNFITMRVSNSRNSSTNLVFGFDRKATDGFDPEFSETELPPLPPAGFDVRFRISDEISTIADFKMETSPEATYKYNVALLNEDENPELTLSWTQPKGMSLKITDAVDGSIINRTYRAGNNELVITNPAVKNLNFELTSFTPVSVEYTNLDAEITENMVTLMWTTSGEEDISHYEIERSNDGSAYLKLDALSATGNSGNYRYTDKYASAGNYFYRMAGISKDGSKTYSDVVEVSFSVPTDYSLMQNWPNPFNPETNIRFSLPVDANVTLSVFDILGQKVIEDYTGEYDAGRHTVNFSGGQLSSGTYIYTIIAKGKDGSSFTESKKMSLIK